MSIGKLQAATGTPISALRFYERQGLLPTPPRVSGKRLYPPEAIDRVLMIRMWQNAGLKLGENRPAPRCTGPTRLMETAGAGQDFRVCGSCHRGRAIPPASRTRAPVPGSRLDHLSNDASRCTRWLKRSSTFPSCDAVALGYSCEADGISPFPSAWVDGATSAPTVVQENRTQRGEKEQDTAEQECGDRYGEEAGPVEPNAARDEQRRSDDVRHRHDPLSPCEPRPQTSTDACCVLLDVGMLGWLFLRRIMSGRWTDNFAHFDASSAKRRARSRERSGPSFDGVTPARPYLCGSQRRSHPPSCGWGRLIPGAHFDSMPWGRAGPVAKAVLKSRSKRRSSSRFFFDTSMTCTWWSPSKWILPKSSSFKK
jgi:DNA-binding transcriptional MerR regulator